MTTLPSRADIVDPQRTVAEAQGDRGDVRDVVAELRGGSAEEALTLASDVVTPTVAALVIDTEGGASTDTLARIVQTNHPDGREIVVRAADPSRRITVTHLASGGGEIELIAGRDITLNARHCLFLRRAGTRWIQMFETRLADGEVGTVGFTASATVPAGGILAHGQLLNTADYAELFAEIGYTYGGSGAQFGLPDLRDRAMIGRGDMGGTAAGRITNTGDGNPGIDTSILGATGGVDRHTITGTEVGSHGHSHDISVSQNDGDHGHGFQDADGSYANFPTYRRVNNTGNARQGTGSLDLKGSDLSIDASTGAHSHTVTGGVTDFTGGTPHPNVQPLIVLNAFIRT